MTARKREESLQDIPLSITAFSEKQNAEACFANVEDIANFTPGLQFHKQASQRTGRINNSIRSSIGPDDVEHVEIGASFTRFDDHEIALSPEGPILAERPAFRVWVSDCKKPARWTANDGGQTGEETTKSITATLYATPTEKWGTTSSTRSSPPAARRSVSG